MLTIELKNLHFHAHHGIYAEETLVGGSFTIDVSVAHIPAVFPITQLKDTIDYGAVFLLVQTRMQQAVPLLETLATSIVADIFNAFVTAEQVDISITKMAPPVIGFQGALGVRFSMNRQAFMASKP